MPTIETNLTPFDFALTILNFGANIVTLITMLILIRVLYRIGNQREKFFDAFLRNPTPQNPGYNALAASMESIDARLQVLATQLTVHSNTMGVSFSDARFTQKEAFDLASTNRVLNFEEAQEAQKNAFTEATNERQADFDSVLESQAAGFMEASEERQHVYETARDTQKTAFDEAITGRTSNFDASQLSQKTGFDAARDADHTLTNPPLATYDARAQREHDEREAVKQEDLDTTKAYG